jgi:hypothetical protein
MRSREGAVRRRSLRPDLSLSSLEERALLNAAMPVHAQALHAPALVLHANQRPHGRVIGASITPVNQINFRGYHFGNFNGPAAGNVAGAGTNMNGISNAGTAVGFSIGNTGSFTNFTTSPWKSHGATLLNINGSPTAQAFGVNRAGTVVGSDGNGNAFVLNRGHVTTFIPPGGTAAVAFGINDRGIIVGQYAVGNALPGFVRLPNGRYLTINAPTGTNQNAVNVQGINNNGLIVGFYVGNDGQDHGFIATLRNARNGTIPAIPVADPVIPPVAGEPGATFVFSQILGINDHGLAVGYYGDSTTSQHGFFYNTRTGRYTFLDDPNVAFNNGIEVTQITGITNSGEITGFYSDANAVFHGFVAFRR